MRTLTFALITDSRLDNDYLLHFKHYSDKIITELNKIEGIELEHYFGRGIEFGEGEKIIKQYRKRFFVKKNTRKITWNDIMKIINDIKVCAYDWVNY